MFKNICIAGLLFMSMAISNSSRGQSSTQPGGTATPNNSLLPHSPEAESLGKFGDIPVGLYTGVPSTSVPIYQLKLKNVTVPISIDYHSSGVKVDELASNVGLDWALNAGGVINVIQYGLSDFGGWLSPAAGFTTPQTAIPQENWNGVSGFATNNDYLFLKGSADGTLDTQPDVFSFTFLGRTGKFFFDQSGGAHVMPYQNIKVDYTMNNNVVSVFVLTDEHGTKFYFSTVEVNITITNNTCGTSPGTTNNLSSSYYLSKITTPNGEELDFTYQSAAYNIANANSEVRYARTDLGSPQSSACPDIPNCVTTSNSTIGGFRLSNITNPNTGDHVVFTYINNRTDIPGTQSLDQVTVFNGAGTTIKSFALSHAYFYSAATNSPNAGDYRLQLTGIQEAGKQPYLFYYNPTTVPSRFSFNQDHWGYYNGPVGNTTLLPVDTLNGFITGANRLPDTAYMKAGILTKVTYPTGGSTDFIYESNDAYRVYDSTSLQFGGAGASASPNQTTTQTFTIPANSAHFQANWVTTDGSGGTGGLDPNGNNTSIVLTGPNGFYENFTGNSNGPVYYDYNNTITFSPGTYTITITNTTSATSAIGSFALSWQTNVTKHIAQNEFVGGLRIKSLVDYPVTGLPKTKFFEYTNVSAPTQSSGVLMYQPNYIFSYYKYSVSGNFVTQCVYTSQQENSLAPLGTIQGGNVIYSNVNVYDDAKTNGYTSNEFVTNGNSYGQTFSPTFPFPPLTNLDWLNGLPVKTTQYKYNITSGVYFPITINQKTYKMATGVGPNETLVRGMKIAYVYPEFTGNISYSPNTYASNVPAQFKVGYYYLYSSWFHLDQETNTLYDTNGLNPATTTTNYYYDNPTHVQLTRTTTTKSDGKLLTNVTTYPDDYAAGTTFLDDMKTNHLVGIPVEQATYQYDGTNTGIIGGQVTQYKTGGAGLIDQVYKLETASVVPLSSYKFSNSTAGQFSFGITPGSYSFDTRYQPRLAYNQYDNLGNPLMITPTGAPTTTYLWGYNKQYPIAEIKNAAYTDVVSVLTQTTIDQLAGGTPGSDATVRSTLNALRTAPALQNVQVTTFTYNPLVGMTSSTDAKGETTYYEYDTVQRLMNVKDKDGNVIKHIDYHYQGQ